jgi:hypothetical protein
LRGLGLLKLPEFGTVETDDFAFELTERTSAKRLRAEGDLQPDHPFTSDGAVLDLVTVFHQRDHRNDGVKGK